MSVPSRLTLLVAEELPEIAVNRFGPKHKFKLYPISYCHIDVTEVQTAEGKFYLYVAIDSPIKFAFVQLVQETGRTREPDDRSHPRQTLSLWQPRQLQTYLADFIDACNVGKRLNTLKGRTPYEYICKA
jgi:hypothetical protein